MAYHRKKTQRWVIQHGSSHQVYNYARKNGVNQALENVMFRKAEQEFKDIFRDDDQQCNLPLSIVSKRQDIYYLSEFSELPDVNLKRYEEFFSSARILIEYLVEFAEYQDNGYDLSNIESVICSYPCTTKTLFQAKDLYDLPQANKEKLFYYFLTCKDNTKHVGMVISKLSITNHDMVNALKIFAEKDGSVLVAAFSAKAIRDFDITADIKPLEVLVVTGQRDSRSYTSQAQLIQKFLELVPSSDLATSAIFL